MEILKNVVTVSIALPQVSSALSCKSFQLKRVEYPSGVIDWVLLSPRKEYKLENGEWSIFNEKTWNYDALNEDPPTWEQEYQEALLAQYPFEKRVREVAEQNVDAGTVMFKLARDFDFVELIKEYLKKLPR